MADVLIVCVREDESQAKALADMFERAGFTVGGAPSNDGALRSCGATVVMWSQAAIRSRPFLDASQRAVNAGKAVLACLIDPPPGDSVGNAPAFDLGDWDGDPEDPNLDPLFFAVDRMVGAARADAGFDTPARPERAPQERNPRERSRAAPAAAPSYARAPYEPPRPAPPRPEPRDLPRTPIPAASRAAPSPARPAYDTPRADPLGSEAEYWRSIRHSREPADFHDYLSKYGHDGAFAELAEIRLKELQGERTPAREAPRRRETQSYPAAPAPRAREPERPAERIAARIQEPDRPMPRALERERDRAPERVRSGGGLGGVLFAVVLLGGAALAGGLYFGMQQQGPAQTAENQNPAAGAQNAPAPSSDESVSYEEAALDPPPQVDSAHDAPRGGPDLPRTPAARQTAAATPPPAPDHAAQQTRDLNAAALSGPVAPVPLTPAPAPVVFVEPTPVVTAPTAAALPARAPGRVSWAAQPPASRIAALYPSRALRTGQNGSARLDCAVRTDFGLSCTIAQESPQGMGFGQAALRAAASFRANRNLSNGDSASGARTSITIRFQGG